MCFVLQGATEVKVHEDMKMESMKIYICQDPDAAGIVIEGVPVLTDLDNLPRACCLLLGMTYALNLQYPSKLSRTFEVFQRLLMGLDVMRPKPSSKYMSLKSKILS